MGRVSLLSCGRCGKPRGLVHQCTGRKKGPAFRAALTMTCGTCGKSHGNPFAHQCAVPSDFRKRKAAQARAAKAEKRRQKRRATAARRRARAAERRRQAAELRKQAAGEAREQAKAARPRSNDRERHDHQSCADLDCGWYPCRIWREGKDAGRAEGHSEGFASGYAEGMQAAMEGMRT